MISNKIDFHQTGAFSSLFLDYINNQEALQPFYALSPSLENHVQALKHKAAFYQQNPSLRTTLHKALTTQYQGITNPPTTQIEQLLHDNTFTVTTGHQLNIFTGPMYFIYKIVTTINLAAKLKETYPDYNFVPVYWMATEDHDFAEINHFHLFNKKYTWESEQKGAVGRFKTDGLASIFEEIPEEIPLFKTNYLESTHLSEATRRIVHELFGEQGLLIIDGDDPLLKAQFKSVILDDVFANSSKQLVENQSTELEEKGYKTQVFPREINFFYMEGDVRERIIQEGDRFIVNNTPIQFNKEELSNCIHNYPERFSPNVVLRPLYQEVILPNLSYVGGPGELAYWLQLKLVFDHYKVPFPILMPRNFALLLNKTSHKKFEKLGIQIEDLFLDEYSLKNKFLLEHASEELLLDQEKNYLAEVFTQISQKVIQVDKSLEGFIGAEKNKALKSLENIEKRLKKAEENKQKTEIKQLLSLKEKLFPGGKLQERHDNFLNFYLNEPGVIQIFLNYFHPFEFKMHVLSDL